LVFLLPSIIHSIFKNSDSYRDADSTLFRSIVGKLVYLANSTCPDLAIALSFFSNHSETSKTIHLAAVKHTCRYLADKVNIIVDLLDMAYLDHLVTRGSVGVSDVPPVSDKGVPVQIVPYLILLI
jgi:hypothetical protein